MLPGRWPLMSWTSLLTRDNVRFRHLDYPNDASIRALGPAALDALLDRGDLNAWKPLAQEIARDPWGTTATTVLHLCDAHEMYGTSSLWRSWIERRRVLSSASEPRTLAEVRKQQGLTQMQMAERLGISQTDVSKLERRVDMRVSSLAAYARALGGTLVLSITRPDSDVATTVQIGVPGSA